MTVGQATLLEDLQERVENVGVGLLDFVEEHHAERLAPHLLSQLTTVFEPDESGRGTKQARDGVFFAVLAHVERNQGVLVVEQELGQCLRELRLSHTGGSGEDERTARTLRVLQARTGAADTAGEHRNGLLLADDPLVQGILHEHESGGLLLGELEHRDPGRGGQHLRNHTLVDDPGATGFTTTPLLLQAQTLGEEVLLLVTQAGSTLEVLALNGRFLLRPDGGNLLVKLAQLWR